MSVASLAALQEDQAVLFQLGGPVEFALCGRDSVRVLEPVVGPEQADVDLAPLDFIQIDLVGPPA